MSRYLWHRALVSSLRSFWTNRRLSITVRQGRRRAAWKTYPGSASRLSWVMVTVPELGVSIPLRMLSSVDLPQPDGPTMDTNT